MRTIVLDTNVLLADPQALFGFGDAEIIVPETVLGEIDKLKTQRVDPDLRFRGREISRILFELSESGSLADGVSLPGGGTLRVAPLRADVDMPEGLANRNADDRILAVAYQVCRDGCEDLTLVTNDLNMLLKAQALGVKVERRAEVEGGFARRYIIRPFQRYRVPLTILAIAIAVFAAVLALAYYATSLTSNNVTATTGVPTEFRDLLSVDQRNLLDGLVALQKNPGDLEMIQQVADAYYNLRDQTGDVAFAQKAIDYYERYLNTKPDAVNVRTDLSAMYFYSGATDTAIQEASRVLEVQPDHIQANFNLGIFYWRGRTDYQAAALSFKKVAELTKDGDAHTQLIGDEAKKNLAAIVKEAATAGQPLDVDALGIRDLIGGVQVQ